MKYRQTGRQMPQKTTFSNGSDKQNAGGGARLALDDLHGLADFHDEE